MFHCDLQIVSQKKGEKSDSYLFVKLDAIKFAHLEEHTVVQHGKVRMKHMDPNDCIATVHQML